MMASDYRPAMTEEEHLLTALDQLWASYSEDAQPYIDRLARIRALRPSDPFFVVSDDALESLSLIRAAKRSW